MLYVTPDELAPGLGQSMDQARAVTACTAVSDWIDARTGTTFGDPDPVPERIHQLALNGARRFYADPDAPFGVIGSSADVPMYMSRLMTDQEALLLGLRVGFGIG